MTSTQNNVEIAPGFWSKEFGFLTPESALLALLVEIRTALVCTVTITDAGRTPKQMVDTYRKLESEGKIATRKNGKGDKDLIDVIPWGSKHMPCFETPNLRAVDFQCVKAGKKLSGADIKKALDVAMAKVKKTHPTGFGVGVGKTYCHIDVRETDAVWYYGY